MGKSGPNATFNLFFLGLGWPWGREFVGFIIFTCFPTQHNLVYCKHPIHDQSDKHLSNENALSLECVTRTVFEFIGRRDLWINLLLHYKLPYRRIFWQEDVRCEIWGIQPTSGTYFVFLSGRSIYFRRTNRFSRGKLVLNLEVPGPQELAIREQKNPNHDWLYARRSIGKLLQERCRSFHMSACTTSGTRYLQSPALLVLSRG